MAYVLSKLLVLSLSGTAAVLLTWAAVRLCGGRIERKWSYYAWILPLLLFVLPMPNGLSEPKFEPVTLPVYEETTGNFAQKMSESEQTLSENAQYLDVEQPSEPAAAKPKPEEPLQVPVRLDRSWTAELGFALVVMMWLAGVVGILLYRAAVRMRFARRLRVICELPDEADRQVFAEICADMGIRKTVAFRRVHAEISPFITGIRKPVIVLPDTVTKEELPLVLRHELTHYRRHDLLYRAAVYAVSALHWFNPAVYVMRHLMEREMELSCDEAALKSMDLEGRRQYGLTVLLLMKRNRNAAPGAAFLSEGGQDIRRRMEGILLKKSYGFWAKVGAFALAAVLVCSTSALSAGLNGANPVQSPFGVNYDSIVGTFAYDSYTEQMPANAGSGRAIIQAALVNTPLSKSFYASVQVPQYRLYGQMQVAEDGSDIVYWNEQPAEVISAQAEIRMDELLRQVNDGRDWFGRFTVTINGEPVMDRAYGVLSDVPGADQQNLTRLNIYDEQADTWVSLYGMRFSLGSEALLQAAKESEQVRDAVDAHADTVERFDTRVTAFTLPQDACPWYPAQAAEETVDETGYAYLRYNPTVGKLEMALDDIHQDARVSAQLSDDFTFTGGSARGRFLVEWHSNNAAEFTGTLSGLDGNAGDTFTLRSDDGAYVIEGTLGEKMTGHSEEELVSYELPENPTARDIFLHGAEAESHRITVEDFPFTVTLAPDKKSVTLTYKEDSGYEGWRATMATYPSNPETEPYIWEEHYSNEGNTFTFSVLDTGVRHYINFTAYNTLPNAKIVYGELSFKLVGDELLYTNGFIRTESNPNLTGEAALPYILEYRYSELKKLF